MLGSGRRIPAAGSSREPPAGAPSWSPHARGITFLTSPRSSRWSAVARALMVTPSPHTSSQPSSAGARCPTPCPVEPRRPRACPRLPSFEAEVPQTTRMIAHGRFRAGAPSTTPSDLRPWVRASLAPRSSSSTGPIRGLAAQRPGIHRRSPNRLIKPTWPPILPIVHQVQS